MHVHLRVFVKVNIKLNTCVYVYVDACVHVHLHGHVFVNVNALVNEYAHICMYVNGYEDGYALHMPTYIQGGQHTDRCIYRPVENNIRKFAGIHIHK